MYFLYLVVLFYCHFICLILYMFELNKWRWRWRFNKKPHRRRKWMVQWYPACCANVHPHLIHISLGPPESTTQTAFRSVQPFLHSSRQNVPILYIGTPLSPFKIDPSHGGFGPPSKYMVPWVHPSPQLRRHLDRFSRFCRAHDRDRQTTPLQLYCIAAGRIYVQYIVLRCGLIIPASAAHWLK